MEKRKMSVGFQCGGEREEEEKKSLALVFRFCACIARLCGESGETAFFAQPPKTMENNKPMRKNGKAKKRIAWIIGLVATVWHIKCVCMCASF